MASSRSSLKHRQYHLPVRKSEVVEGRFSSRLTGLYQYFTDADIFYHGVNCCLHDLPSSYNGHCTQLKWVIAGQIKKNIRSC